MAEMKAGYKQTDIGIIPEDWDIKSYGEVFDFLSTISNSRADLCFKGDFGYIHYGDIHTRWENTLDLSKSELPELRRDKIKKLPASLRDGDLVMADASEDYEGIAKTVEVKNIGEKKVFSGLHTFLMRDRNAVFSDGIRGYIHEMPVVRQQIQKVATGLKVFGVSKNTLKNVQIPVPKPEEQKQIAAALSDVDGLIESLSQLIAKKRDMKTAAMQQLLTGKKRLPGFESITGYQQTDVGLIPKDWELVRLGYVADIDNDNLSSGTPSSYEIRYISLEDVKEGSLLGFSTLYFMSAPSRARRKLKYGDVLLGTVRPNLKSHLLFRQEGENFVCSTGFAAIRPYPHKANNEYIYAHLFGDVINHQIDKVLAGSNYPAISNSDVKNLFIPLPKTEEQTAIAAVLSDMDTEIDALEQRLEKARNLKTGMMQELLTGKTRLIKTNKKQEAA